MSKCQVCGRSIPLFQRMASSKICQPCVAATPARIQAQKTARIEADLAAMTADINRQLGAPDAPTITLDDAIREAASASTGGFELPEYPGERDPDCTCSWEISETEAYWRLDDDAPCTNARCRRNAVTWNPFVFLKAGHK